MNEILKKYQCFIDIAKRNIPDAKICLELRDLQNQLWVLIYDDNIKETYRIYGVNPKTEEDNSFNLYYRLKYAEGIIRDFKIKSQHVRITKRLNGRKPNNFGDCDIMAANSIDD